MRPCRPFPPRPSASRGVDEESTAILPRSRQGQHRTRTQAPLDAIDDYDEDERKPLGRHAKLALLIGAVAVVVVIGLVIGYAVLSAASQRQNQPTPPTSPGGSGTSSNASQLPARLGRLC